MTNQEQKQTQETVQERFDEVRKYIDQLEARTLEANREVNEQVDASMNELRAQRDDFERRLREWQSAGSQASDEMRKGLEDAWESLRTAFGQAAQHLKN